MASNQDQNDARDSMPDDPFASNDSLNERLERCRGSETQISSLKHHQQITHKSQMTATLNDSHILRKRRVDVDHSRRSLELMCEDKVSQNKLELAHCSSPSSSKNTFIMTFSPDGRRVASTHGDHRIYICDLATGKLLDTLEGHPKTPWCLAWHPSNKEILASGCLAGEVRVWDLKSKACEIWMNESNNIIYSMNFHPKHRLLIIATSNAINFWDWSESEPFAKAMTIHDKEKVKFVKFDSSGTKLITGITNLPKFNSDSLQNRLIDSYFSPSNIDQLNDMTHNSEIIGSPQSTPFNSNNSTRHNPSIGQISSTLSTMLGTNANTTENNEQDIGYQSTVTMSRIAFLYRQLEALEDSIRHTSFVPYVPNHIDTFSSASSNVNLDDAIQTSLNDHDNGQTARGSPPIQDPHHYSSQSRIEHASRIANTSSARITVRYPGSSEPFVVAFDESLAHLQLLPLSIDGQLINSRPIIDQYPLDAPTQPHFMMQLDSINQVNQNFIRISKLMSSIRLYRQVTQQILTSNSSDLPSGNQILTAQSTPRLSQRTPNLPTIFRTLTTDNSFNSGALNQVTTSADPIMAVQFRSSARNIPLVTICRIDLLIARCVCIMRSQQLVEQTMLLFRATNQEQTSNVGGNHNPGTMQAENHDQEGILNYRTYVNADRFSDSDNANISFYPLLNQLHQSLTSINHAPLTTSNVSTHIESARSLVNQFLDALASMLNNQNDAMRLIRNIYDIAHSLTGREWDSFVGINLTDMRLDVIHTLCIIDLSLHLARQVQLLQMQRLTAIARMRESRTTADILNASNQSSSASQKATLSSQNINTNDDSKSNAFKASNHLDQLPGPSTSRDDQLQTMAAKRKAPENSPREILKRTRLDAETPHRMKLNYGYDMFDVKRDSSSSPTNMAPPILNQQDANPLISTPANPSQPMNLPSLLDNLPDDRMLVWNGIQSSGIEHSLHRFLVAAAASMSQYNSHILVRIYSRLHGSTPVTLNGSDDQQLNLTHGSRQRTTSRDTPSTIHSVDARHQSGHTSRNSSGGEQARARPPPIVIPINESNGSTGPGSTQGNLHRNPHLHIYQTRGNGQHLWFNQWTIPLPASTSNYRVQCWDFTSMTIPNIKDTKSNMVTQKCRIHNDASIDISSNGYVIACLVPRDDSSTPQLDLKIFSLRTMDFGACYHQIPHGPNAALVSLSPSANYAVVGMILNRSTNCDNDNHLTIAKISRLTTNCLNGHVRDLKVRKDVSCPFTLNAIRWLSHGIIYNIGPKNIGHRIEVGGQ